MNLSKFFESVPGYIWAFIGWIFYIYFQESIKKVISPFLFSGEKITRFLMGAFYYVGRFSISVGYLIYNWYKFPVVDKPFVAVMAFGFSLLLYAIIDEVMLTRVRKLKAQLAEQNKIIDILLASDAILVSRNKNAE